MTRLRNPHIETLRGIACVLLVAFHVVGTSDSGMNVADDSFWRSFVDLMTPIRMPLFAFISGFVMTLSVATLADFKTSLLSKLRRLGLPLLTVTTLYNLIYGVAGMEHFVSSPLELYAYPYIHLWYLQSSILMIVIVMTVAFIAGASYQTATLVLFPLSLIASQIVPVLGTDIFSITGASYLLPFFCLGVVVRQDLFQVAQYLKTSTFLGKISLTSILIGLLFAVLWLGWFTTPEGKIELLPIATSCLFCLGIFALRMKFGWLTWVGSHSYAIFLFHPMFSSASRHVLQTVDQDMPQLVIFAVGLFSGILLSIAASIVILENRVTSLLLLGIPFSKFPNNFGVINENQRTSGSRYGTQFIGIDTRS